MEMRLPKVYKNANDGMSRLTRARLENNEVILPKQKQNAKPYQRCLQLSAGIHPSSLVSNNIFEHEWYVNRIYGEKKIPHLLIFKCKECNNKMNKN